ncbi:hypothetical protein [Nocardioides sp.]|uniref:hypothetical protein n=1 Tax=Nocardioides sp. TaxID=35761 RepID=UPI0039E22B88
MGPAEAEQGESLVVEFCGEEYRVDRTRRFSVGREADLVVDDDNAFLHRRIVELFWDNGFWWIANVGSRLSVTVSGEAGTLQSWLGPGSRLPMVLPALAVLFTAGGTTYELTVSSAEAAFMQVLEEAAEATVGRTLGHVELTPSQFRLLLALAENTLRRAGTGPSDIPTNVAAARRLGWSATTFNRKLDNVCDKYARAGVKGLRGAAGSLATGRRARLVEYVVAARIVRPHHLPLLDRIGGEEE